MDPWNNSEEITKLDGTSPNKFEDNFVCPAEIDKLPDSEKYLATLEDKLHKIRSNPNVIEQLTKKKEECLNQLLNDSGCDKFAEDFNLDEPIESPAILRTIQPQKQALTQGEIVELLKYDRLENSENSDDSSEEKKSDTN